MCCQNQKRWVGGLSEKEKDFLEEESIQYPEVALCTICGHQRWMHTAEFTRGQPLSDGPCNVSYCDCREYESYILFTWKPSFKRIFNRLMIWGAVLGFIIFSAVGTIQDTWHHKGYGRIWYENPDRVEMVSEGEYKRHKYTMGIFMLGLGVVGWIWIANDERPKVKGVPP